MRYAVIYYVTQVFLISIHKRGNCLSGKHTLKMAGCFFPCLLICYHEIISKIKIFLNNFEEECLGFLFSTTLLRC